ncbi:Glutamyl-tRNA(Gln) amidotransferase subunit A [Seminavis robusta]|uniref:Glutamyl-tRNA(Gln) amidotransferase subunit A n=1 Tax=Seminavis robusta TaxID=568900 RepID=A0A9N8F4I5_9STRA|nr:Glutamyl-tRNA(Gln) amidotransferase subunit A [Seminavis robusta]|eukprot:Sro3644_g349950.1 Glutamyl-tRNA(Gln) amidotransferase subunit A (654) ;mRNA; f:1968-4042
MASPMVARSLVGAGLVVALAMLVSGKHTDMFDQDGGRLDLWMSIALVVASLTVLLSIGLVTSEVPIPPTPRIKLGTHGYDLTPVNSPACSGFVLRVVARIVGSKVLGHLIIRPILNNNNPWMLRDLARQIASERIPIMSLPFCRVDGKTVTDDMAKTATDALQQGLPRSYTAKDIVGVMDYYIAYTSGAVKPSEMMTQVLEGMEKLKYMSMFMASDKESVMEQAKASDERWARQAPLSVWDGVPVSVKDFIKVKGYKRSNGMTLLDSDPVQTKDDIMVKRFREAGAIILGTTVLTEYGRCPLGYNSHYKGPFNPYDESCYSGGSSSGSVCSVMTGLVPVGISFDGGGSIRLPAAFSGAFGLAPTFGRVPFDSDASVTSGNVHAGVNTATTTDTALAYALLAQNEPGHMINQVYDGDVHGPPRPHLTDFDKIDNFEGLRIGVFWDYFNDSDPEIAASCKAVITELEKRGAKVVEVSIPHLKAMSLAHGLNISVAFSALEETHFYHRDDLEPATKIQLQMGKTVTGTELMSCNRIRGWAAQYVKKLFAEEMDVFITPSCPIVAPRIAKDALECGESNLPLLSVVMRYVPLVNLCGFPGMAIPVAYSEKEKLPISVQFVADHWKDALLLRLSHFVEKHMFERVPPKHFVQMNLNSS